MENILNQVKNARSAEIEVVDLKSLFEGLTELVTATEASEHLSTLHSWLALSVKEKGNLESSDLGALEFFSKLLLHISSNRNVIDSSYQDLSNYMTRTGLE